MTTQDERITVLERRVALTEERISDTEKRQKADRGLLQSLRETQVEQGNDIKEIKTVVSEILDILKGNEK